jgi:hypothetical protein
MTKPTVTKAMQQAAERAYDAKASSQFQGYCYSGPMRAAITAAIEASGLVDRIAELEGLAWIAYHEFNAIKARSGAPLDQYQMTTVCPNYWQSITTLLAKAAGSTDPWPTPNAKAILETLNKEPTP